MKLFILFSLLFSSQIIDRQTLTDFQSVKTDRTIINKGTLKKDMPVMIFYSDPELNFNNDKTELFECGANEFEEINMHWVPSNEGDSEEIDLFYDYYFEDLGLPYYSISKVESTILRNWFGYSEATKIFINNSKWELIDGFYQV